METATRVTADTFEQAVEAVVFASDAPLRPEDVARIYGEVTGAETSGQEVEEAVGRINAGYRVQGRAIRIERWAGGLRMATVEEVAPFVRAQFSDAEAKRLSKSLLETLAVIAYKQPVTKPEIDHVRGVSSDYALRQLLERDLAVIAGRGEGVGRPLLYATTDHFLDQFGLDGLGDLPSPREIEEILADPVFKKERARLLAEIASPTSSASVSESDDSDRSEPADSTAEAVPPDAPPKPSDVEA